MMKDLPKYATKNGLDITEDFKEKQVELMELSREMTKKGQEDTVALLLEVGEDPSHYTLMMNRSANVFLVAGNATAGHLGNYTINYYVPVENDPTKNIVVKVNCDIHEAVEEMALEYDIQVVLYRLEGYELYVYDELEKVWTREYEIKQINEIADLLNLEEGEYQAFLTEIQDYINSHHIADLLSHSYNQTGLLRHLRWEFPHLTMHFQLQNHNAAMIGVSIEELNLFVAHTSNHLFNIYYIEDPIPAIGETCKLVRQKVRFYEAISYVTETYKDQKMKS
jgi:hypothetical protein